MIVKIRCSGRSIPRLLACSCLLFGVVSRSTALTNAASLPQQDWIQYVEDKYCYSLATDATGNSYISGQMVDGPGAFLAKFDPSGAKLWQRDWGDKHLNPMRATTDGFGNVYVAGQYTPPTLTRSYVMVTKYTQSGEFQWMKQFDWGASSKASDVAADQLGNLFIGGDVIDQIAPNRYEKDGFVSRLDSGGNLQWMRRFETNFEDEVSGIEVDHLGNVYFAGSTAGALYAPNLGQYDGFVGKLNCDGEIAWSKQLGTNLFDYTVDVAVAPEGMMYVLGNTEGDLSGGEPDYVTNPFIRKYDASGAEVWTRQLEFNNARGVLSGGLASDQLGNVSLTGWLYLTGDWQPNNTDAFAAQYDADGELKWSLTFGSDFKDEARGISMHPQHGIFISGLVSNASSPYETNAFVTRFRPIPEPTTSVLVTLAAGLFFSCAKSRRRARP